MMSESGRKTDTGDNILLDDDFKSGEIFASERQRALNHIAYCAKKHPDSVGLANECGVVVFLNGRAALRFGGTFGTTDGKRWPSKSQLLYVVCRAICPVIKAAKEGQLPEFTEKEKYVLYRE